VAETQDLDLASAHRFFSTHCFNAVWDLIDKPERSVDEDDAMVQLSLTSLWHWTQREDCSASNLSVGYWQVSRVYALVGRAEDARRYAQRCLQVSDDDDDDVGPFYLGYAYEALARAASVAGDRDTAEDYLAKAREVAQTVPDAQSRQMLLDDLVTIM
jgi:tetratricopeptide (TPR) repeat protein